MHPWQLREAVRLLRGGGVVAYPTEAVYGLGCNPLDPEPVYRILALKGRQLSKGLILIAADWADLAAFHAPLNAAVRERIAAAAGPVTWLLPARAEVPAWLTGGTGRIALRVTAHPVAAALCRAFGALVSTSANPAGLPPARSALGVRRFFGDRVDCIVHGAVGPAARPTEIRDALTGAVIRPG